MYYSRRDCLRFLKNNSFYYCSLDVLKVLYIIIRSGFSHKRMGCVHSRKDISDIHPNIFRVVNIDECGNGLWPGQIEVTDVELVLYRRGRDATKWPLRSLRRYGFDGDIFSFESGRRCATGQGIYAFRCRRAEQLFTTLQQYIQERNLSMDTTNLSIVSSISSAPPLSLRPALPMRQLHRADSLPIEMLPTTIEDISAQNTHYLEPVRTSANQNVSRFSGAIRLNSLSSGPISPDIHSPGSPSSANILEVMPLNPLPESNHVTNLYQLREFPLREHNNNRKIMTEHSYTNTGDVNSDLFTLRKSLRAQNTATISDEFEDLESAHTAERKSVSVPISPALSHSPEQHRSVLEQEPLRLYMNLLTHENTVVSSTEHVNYQNSHTMQMYGKNLYTNDPMRIETLKVIEVEEERHCYANLVANEVNCDPKLLSKQISSNSKFTFTDIHKTSLVEMPKMNYAVLDLPPSKDELKEVVVKPVLRLPPESPKSPCVGYTTIDFNKTVALSSINTCADVDNEGSRRTRHNSNALPLPSTSGV